MRKSNAKVVAEKPAETRDDAPDFFEALAAAVKPILDALCCEDERERAAAWMLMGAEA